MLFKACLPAVVIKGEATCLMGRNWLQQIHLNWSEILHLTTVDKVLVEVLEALSNFSRGFGQSRGEGEDLR